MACPSLQRGRSDEEVSTTTTTTTTTTPELELRRTFSCPDTVPTEPTASPFLSKPTFRLRLPVDTHFDPNTSLFSHATRNLQLLSCKGNSVLGDELHMSLNSVKPSCLSASALPVQPNQSTPLLTPPDEIVQPPWTIEPVLDSLASESSSMDPPPKPAKENTPKVHFVPRSAATDDSERSSTCIPGENQLSAAGGQSSSTVPQSTIDQTDNSDTPAWLEEAFEVALSSPAVNSGRHIKVLSHALPCPTPDDSNATQTTAFPNLISQLQTRVQAIGSGTISITHAVPKKFPLTDLPTSPPGTPNLGVGGQQEDYFNTSVFTSAVPVIDRHNTFGGVANTAIPSSPCLAVAPGSVDMSLVERFIPPGTVQEFLDLFSPSGPSVLTDRLAELSPNNGTLIFVYPTRTGGHTFTSDHLGPILDPLLRGMVVIHQLSADISINIGKMVSVEHLLEFDQMKRKVHALLRRLNRGTSQQIRPDYQLSHATKQMVRIERKVWTKWYEEQEAPRIREVMTRYFQRSVRLPDGVNSAILSRQILTGLSERKYANVKGPGEPIEVGVFVIKRRT
ncbi:hypothetical protein MMC09_000395 [Bachmanniomyces sp. S44760]|nr:hypothetical protein [Bachmanniomyces sp. S44760]